MNIDLTTILVIAGAIIAGVVLSRFMRARAKESGGHHSGGFILPVPTCSGLTSTALVLVRITPESGHVRRKPSCPLWAKSGHDFSYSITSSARVSSSDGGTLRLSHLPA